MYPSNSLYARLIKGNAVFSLTAALLGRFVVLGAICNGKALHYIFPQMWYFSNLSCLILNGRLDRLADVSCPPSYRVLHGIM